MDLNHAWSELAVLAQCGGSIKEGNKKYVVFYLLFMTYTKFSLYFGL